MELRIDSGQIGENTKRWQGFQIRPQAGNLSFQGLPFLISLRVSFDKQQSHLEVCLENNNLRPNRAIIYFCVKPAPEEPSTGARVGG